MKELNAAKVALIQSLVDSWGLRT